MSLRDALTAGSEGRLQTRRLLLLAFALLAWLIGSAMPFGQVDPYEEALAEYRRGAYASAVELLEAKPDKDAGDWNLLGWARLRTGKAEEAADAFLRSLSLDANSNNSYCGLGHVALTGESPEAAKRHFEKAPNDPDCADGMRLAQTRLGSPTHSETETGWEKFAQAENLVRSGKNLEAARVLKQLVDSELPAAGAARSRLLEIYGMSDFQRGALLPIPSAVRRDRTQASFRARGDSFEAWQDGRWKRVYVTGVNLGPARPGEFPSTPPLDVQTYRDWLAEISQMNANTLRVYTILPPSFYQALKVHNEGAARKLWLMQEIWLEEKENEYDLYERSWSDDFKRELRDCLDVIHGAADIPFKQGHASGIYTADVSEYVLGLGLGRELEPATAMETNRLNPLRSRYAGEYVSLEAGNAAEVWFAEMADYAIRYQAAKYNSFTPVTIVNWPPLDPMSHPTEADYAEELRIRKGLGENVNEKLTRPINDTDAVSLDVMRFKASGRFPAGIFAAYHVYPHWPDFLFLDRNYPKTKDGEGSNRYLGYLLHLKKHHRGMPLLIAEYGISTSWGSAHLHPDGWGNGGLTEAEQAKILVRMTRNIRDSGCAGGLLFAWQDEWWKRVSDYFTRPFSTILEDKPLWLNQYDPEQHFGVVGYVSSARVPLLRGEDEDWRSAKTLAFRAESQSGALRKLLAVSDETYLYLRLDLRERENRYEDAEFKILLNTLPGMAGARSAAGMTLPLGANFQISFKPGQFGAIHIAENYNPNQWVSNPIIQGGRRLWRKSGVKLKVDEAGFEEMVVEANQPRWARDGTPFPPQFTTRSPLRHGTADPLDRAHSSHAAWRFDPHKSMLEARIPWGLIYFMSPPKHLVYGGTGANGDPLPVKTPGIAVVAAMVDAWRGALLETLPDAQDGEIASPPVYTWEGWQRVKYRAYKKAAYTALKDAFAEVSAR
jgi:hypothetical protein